MELSDSNKDKIEKTDRQLQELYKKIPQTTGCMQNINHPTSPCQAWCCKLQQPQVLLSEFSVVMKYMTENWSSDQILDIIKKALESYVSNKQIKGCIFHDSDSLLCKIHEKRPMNCRIYGIIPKEEFNKRLEKIREMIPNEDIREQCDLVSTEDGSEVTTSMTDAWFEALTTIEVDFGVLPKSIHEKTGGTYRTFPDHLLLNMFPTKILHMLSEVKAAKEEESKKKFIEILVENLRKSIHESQKDKKQEQ